MASEPDGSPVGSTSASVARRVLSLGNLMMGAAGMLAGGSLAVLGKETIVVPLIGSMPGILVGAVGLTAALAVYRQANCCNTCGENECGCSGGCGDRCSYEP